MDNNLEKAFDDIEKSIRPEITKEQLGMVIEHLMEAIESMIEVPEEETEDTESETSDIEDMAVAKAYEDCGCETCKAKNTTCDKCEECMSKSYDSDNEDEDKWDNMEKACWAGYTQRGMKEKNGRMVPNCVPVEKAYDVEDKEEPKIKKSIWDGTFIK